MRTIRPLPAGETQVVVSGGDQQPTPERPERKAANVELSSTTRNWNAAAATPSQIPVLPGMYALTPARVVDNVWEVKYGSNTADPAALPLMT